MSLSASRRAWSATPDTIRGTAYTILLALADYADDRGLCWPKLAVLARKAHACERQTSSLLRELEDAGLIVIARKPGRDGGMLFAVTVGLDVAQKAQCLHHFETEKVQFLTLKGAISCKEKVQFLQAPESRSDASPPAETAPASQCNDHKNDHERSDVPTSVGAAPREREVNAGAITQAPLAGLPEPAPPSSAAPPARPTRTRAPKATPEQSAIRSALRAAAGWGPSAKANAQSARAGDALMELDPAVTPARVEAFAARWWTRHSPLAAIKARSQEPVTPPTPEQVLQHWPGYQAWEAAQAAAAAETAHRHERGVVEDLSPEERAEIKAIARRAWWGAAPASPRPALSARGRAT